MVADARVHALTFWPQVFPRLVQHIAALGGINFPGVYFC